MERLRCLLGLYAPAACVAIAALMSYGFLLKPSLTRSSTLESQMKTFQSRVTLVTTQMAQALPGVQARIRESSDPTGGNHLTSPERGDEPLVARRLAELARALGLQVMMVGIPAQQLYGTSQGNQEEGVARQLVVNLTLQGSYRQVGQFMEDLETGELPCRLLSLEAKAAPAGQGLEVTMAIGVPLAVRGPTRVGT